MRRGKEEKGGDSKGTKEVEKGVRREGEGKGRVWVAYVASFPGSASEQGRSQLFKLQLKLSLIKNLAYPGLTIRLLSCFFSSRRIAKSHCENQPVTAAVIDVADCTSFMEVDFQNLYSDAYRKERLVILVILEERDGSTGGARVFAARGKRPWCRPSNRQHPYIQSGLYQ